MKHRKSIRALSTSASVTAVVLIIIASIFATYSYLNANGGRNQTVSVTTTQTTITTATAVTTASIITTIFVKTHNQSSQLYELMFNQTDPCKNFGTIIPWSVVLTTSDGTYNITEPFNSSVPLQCCGSSGSLAYSSIVFSVPNGTYFYEVYGVPRASGNVTVNGHDITIIVQDLVASCGSTSLSSSTTTSTGSTTDSVNTFFSTSCSISGVGGFEFRLVSDSTGRPVNATSISAVDRLGCGNENQVVYLDNFSYLGDGWFTPVFPSQATLGGGLNITVIYEGNSYNFSGYYAPVGTDCVTLSVPSGNENSTTAMNGCS